MRRQDYSDGPGRIRAQRHLTGRSDGLLEMNERDLQLLAILDPDDRSSVEAIVDEIIEESLPSSEPAFLNAAALSFDERAKALPEIDKLTAWQIAAALRARAAPGFPLN